MPDAETKIGMMLRIRPTSRPDAAIGSGRVGAGELCSPKPVAGGAEPFQGSAVYRPPSVTRRFEASLP